MAAYHVTVRWLMAAMCPLAAMLVAFVVEAAAQGVVQVTPCKNPGRGELKALTATPCESHPCEIEKGGVVTFAFEFVPDEDSETMTVDAHVTVMGFYLRIPGFDSDLCQQATQCPIKKGQSVFGSFNMSVPQVPLRRATVEVNIFGDHGMMACFTHPVELK